VFLTGQAGPPLAVVLKWEPCLQAFPEGPEAFLLAARRLITRLFLGGWAADVKAFSWRPAFRLHLPMYKFDRTSINLIGLNDTHCRCINSYTQNATKVTSAIVHHRFMTLPSVVVKLWELKRREPFMNPPPLLSQHPMITCENEPFWLEEGRKRVGQCDANWP